MHVLLYKIKKMNEIRDNLDAFLKSKNYVSPWLRFDQVSFSLLFEEFEEIMIEKDKVLYRQDERNIYIYVVKKGRIRISFNAENGTEKSFYIAEEGSMIGEISAIDNLPNYSDAIAIVDTILYQIPKKVFMDHIPYEEKS